MSVHAQGSLDSFHTGKNVSSHLDNCLQLLLTGCPQSASLAHIQCQLGHIDVAYGCQLAMWHFLLMPHHIAITAHDCPLRSVSCPYVAHTRKAYLALYATFHHVNKPSQGLYIEPTCTIRLTYARMFLAHALLHAYMPTHCLTSMDKHACPLCTLVGPHLTMHYHVSV